MHTKHHSLPKCVQTTDMITCIRRTHYNIMTTAHCII